MTSVAATQFLPVVASASATKDFLVVSIHDVAPSTQSITQKILSELGDKGIHHCSLLVVPNYHHQGNSMQDPQFVSWLRQLEANGHEIVIHGYFHERPKAARETLLDKIVTQFYTQGEGEFYDLNYDEAFRRIITARDEFRAAGLKPRGFVAPAWLLSHAARRAARDAEMEYTTHLRHIVDLRSNENFPSRSLVYSVRNGWRRTVSLAWNAALHRALEGKPLLRLSIHPPDFSHPAIWRQILEYAGELGRVRTPTTYQDWIGDQRVKRAL
ncbi:MAG TPA: polysaccharide deacetylase family protein [Chthoniobacterales bacterium]|nr:polysaccharide deacetylase family protein [Chthoniobacterales bacterium]